MKHLKNAMLSERRILIALIGLLFVMGFVHTMGIMSISRSLQSAQVKDAAGIVKSGPQVFATSSCLSVTPTYSRLIAGDGSENDSPNQSFNMYYTVKNNCSQAIHLLDTGTFTGQYLSPTPALLMGDLERLNLGAPVAVNPQTNPFEIYLNNENLVCIDCNGGVMTYNPSSIGGYNNMGTMSIGGYKILAGQTKKVVVQAWLGVPWQFDQSLRIVPKRFKWFYDGALADNNVAESEILTRTFTSAETAAATTDFLYNYMMQ